MTLLSELAPPASAPTGRRPRAGIVLIAAAVIAVVSVIGALLNWPVAVEVVLLVVAVLVTGWAAWVAMRRPSLVLAPLAVCIVAVGNPASIAGMTAYVEAHAGVITVRTADGFGLVFWKQYPGVAGWTAPADPQPVDTVAFAASVQAAVRSVVDATSTAFGLEWRVAEGASGLTSLPNGYGGSSMFDRIDSAEWHTTLDGSPAQRVALLAATSAAATTLSLGQAEVVSGDPATGTGTVTWSDADGALTLVLDADGVTVSYTGGPLLTGTSLPGEYQNRIAGFSGLTPPDPLVVPDVPQR